MAERHFHFNWGTECQWISIYLRKRPDSIDFNEIDARLRQIYPYVGNLISVVPGMGRSYSIGADRTTAIKLDLYYTDPFIRPLLEIDGIRMASTEDIAAMKMEVIHRIGRKKDFWDVYELNNFSRADEDFDPICLRGSYWELIKLDLELAV